VNGSFALPSSRANNLPGFFLPFSMRTLNDEVCVQTTALKVLALNKENTMEVEDSAVHHRSDLVLM
jgi:hypothetical protein